MDKKLFQEIIVSYDIEDNRRRKRMCDFLKDTGLLRIQKSVFWGYVNRAEYRSIYRAFADQLSQSKDLAFIVPVRLREQIMESGFGYHENQLPELTDYEIV